MSIELGLEDEESEVRMEEVGEEKWDLGLEEEWKDVEQEEEDDDDEQYFEDYDEVYDESFVEVDVLFFESLFLFLLGFFFV